MTTGTPRHSWTDHTTLITAAKLNELEQDVADGLATATTAETGLAGKAPASHSHPVTDLTATGTRSATTFLCGDNTWATPGGGGIAVDTLVYNVKDHGAIGDGTTDDTAAIQNLIDTVSAAGGGTVYFPTGTYVVAQLAIKNRVWLVGASMRGTVLKHKASTAGNMVKNYLATGTEANGQTIGVMNLMLDGSANGGSVNNGIHLEQSSNPTAGDDWNDSRWTVEHVMIYGFRGDGFTVTHSRNGGRAINVHCFDNDGYGFKVNGSDVFFISCDAGASGLAGFWTDGTSTHFVNCKSWFSGAVTATAGHGFHLNDTQPGGSVWTGCDAQDNRGAGWRIEAGSHGTQISGCTADSNSHDTAGQNAAVEIADSSACHIDVVCFQRQYATGTTATQLHALKMTGSNTGNNINLAHRGMGGQVVTAAIDPASSSSAMAGNIITINGQHAKVPAPLADAATITVDASLSNTFRVSLAGDRTLAVPTDGIDGQEVVIEALASGATRALTLNGSYLLTTGITSPISIASGKRQIIRLLYNSGIGWIVISSTVLS